MKKSFYIYLTLSSILACTFTSCSEDFLEETNPNEISTESFWKTVDDLDAGLTSVYNAFKNTNIMSVSAEYNRSDMTYPGWGRPNTNDVYYLQTFNDAAGAPNSKWESLYKGIFRANQVIMATDDLMGSLTDDSSKERASIIKTQATFFRGLFYFYLHNSFNKGSVIIYDFVPQNEADFYQPMRSPQEVEEFYLKDLEYAYENLPPKWTNNRDLGRVTSGAAAAVLGKSYLYDANYAKAMEYFKDVIENPDYGYALTEKIGDNFSSLTELNKESILEISYSINYKAEINVYAEEQVSNTLNFAFSPKGGWRSVLPSLWVIDAYKKDSIDINDPRNQVTDEDGTTRFRKYSLRTSYSLALVDDPDLPYYGLTTAQAAAFNNKETGYYRKYTNWETTENEKDISSQPRSGINVRVIRLADVYLMYAECLIKGGTDNGRVQEAMAYINKVRHRSALQLLGAQGSGEFPAADHDGKSYDAKMLMEELMYVERPLELSVEGNAIRHIDLRRWGITKQRFEELSKRKYYADDYKFIDVDGKEKTRWGSILIEGEKGGKTVLDDYKITAQNYIESEHSYWPVPNSESITNPSVK